MLCLSNTPSSTGCSLLNQDALGAPAYDALGAMLRVNTSLDLELPDPFPHSDVGDQTRLLESRKQMIIEQQLNEVGRGYLLALSSHTAKEDWVDALHNLSSYNDSPSFEVSCLYNLLRLSPEICIRKAGATFE